MVIQIILKQKKTYLFDRSHQCDNDANYNCHLMGWNHLSHSSIAEESSIIFVGIVYKYVSIFFVNQISNWFQDGNNFIVLHSRFVWIGEDNDF